MEARPLNIVTVLQDPKRLVVPVYQRTYEWTIERQIGPFFAQVEAKAEQQLEGNRGLPHYMGALLLMPRGAHVFGTLPVFDVVDGQQRLTTFQIFLAALMDLANCSGQEIIAAQIKPYLLNLTQSLMQNEAEERYKLHTTPYDRKLFRDLIDLGHAEIRKDYPQAFYKNGKINNGTARKPLQAYWFLREAAAEFVRGANGDCVQSRLGALAGALLEDIRVIVITLGLEDDAQVIFETLNSGGEPLAAMDLVRNDVFHRAVRQGENVEQLMTKRWGAFEEPFWKKAATQGRLKKPRIDFFLAHTLAAETGKEILLSELYARYKAFVADRQFQSVDAELQTLLQHAPTYRALAEPAENDALGVLARRLEVFDVSTAIPLVFVIAAGDAADEEKAALYELIASYVIRRALCGLTPKNYNNTFIRIAGRLSSRGVSRVELSAAFAESSRETVRFPDDDELTAAILRQPQYGRMLQPRLRLILTELEIASRDKFDEATGVSEGLSIEHVLPDQWTTHWPLLDGTVVPDDMKTGMTAAQLTQIDNREAVKHTLGNLTLLTQPANSEGKNFEFKRKCERLKTSLLAMNQDIASLDGWSEEEIRQRSEQLARLAVRLWPAPAVLR